MRALRAVYVRAINYLRMRNYISAQTKLSQLG